MSETYDFRCGCGASLSVPVHVRRFAMTDFDEAQAERRRDNLLKQWRADHIHCLLARCARDKEWPNG